MGSNTTTDTAGASNSAPRFGPGSTFATDSGNSALGQSEGQTSSGTAVGNSGSALGPSSSATLGTGEQGTATNTNTQTGTNGVNGLPGVAGSGGVLISGSGQGPISTTTPNQGTTSVTQTPLFDQAAREGQAREARRRARGDEPRVYGIAPRTDRDLTSQMPDDPIIRY